MEKLCIDVRGFSHEKKKRVQDAFFKLGLKWSFGADHAYLDVDSYGNVYSDNGAAIDDLMWNSGDMSEQQRKYAITYTDLMCKAGMDESDPDVIISTPTAEDLERAIARFDAMAGEPDEESMSDLKLQPGDYTTREEIKAYAQRVGIPLEHAYLRICDALVTGGADIGEGVDYTASSLNGYGWSLVGNEIYFGSSDDPDNFARHLEPEQILSTNKQEDLQSEKQADEVAPKQIGELTVGVRLTNYPRDLQSVINHYLWLLDSLTDEQARDIIKSQLTDLTDLQYKQLNGENNNA